MAWVLRIVSAGRWKGNDAAKVARDLELRKGETGLSVFWMDTPEDADRIGVLFGMYRRNKPREVDYVLIPERCLVAFRLVARPDRSLPPELADWHYEIEGMGDVEDASLVLARAILADDAKRVKHMREGEVLSLAARLVEEDPGRKDALTEEWRRALADWKPPG